MLLWVIALAQEVLAVWLAVGTVQPSINLWCADIWQHRLLVFEVSRDSIWTPVVSLQFVNDEG